MKKVDLIIDETVRNLCCRPYPLHKKGCPNFGKRKTCPPQAALVTDILDLFQPVYAIWNVFDLAAHVKRMQEAHPLWSDRQLYCCLYWQPKARKELRSELMRLVEPSQVVLTCPEACGINVTETMRGIGEVLEWPPLKKVYQVAIVGAPRRRNNHK